MAKSHRVAYETKKGINGTTLLMVMSVTKHLMVLTEECDLGGEISELDVIKGAIGFKVDP